LRFTSTSYVELQFITINFQVAQLSKKRADHFEESAYASKSF